MQYMLTQNYNFQFICKYNVYETTNKLPLLHVDLDQSDVIH